MSPSSSVSVGILPSNRTLLFGVVHLDRLEIEGAVKVEQFPTCDDPFTDTVSAVGKFETFWNLMEKINQDH